jgi:predicted PurR-regulated permease PerM
MTDTGGEDVQRPLFYILVLTAGYLAYLILSPFLKPLAWAGVFAIMLQWPQQRLSSRMGGNRAALVTTLLAAVLIVAPGITLVAILANEVPEVNTYIQQASLTAPRRVEQIWQAVRSRSPIPLPENPAALVREGVRRALTFLAPRAGAVVADLVATLGSLAVMLFTLFFMLRDGHIMSRHLRDLLPLPPRQSERLMTETRDLVIASVGASLLVSAAQGAIAGLAFWLLGMKAPALWGVMTAFCSLVPVVGAALVWVPASLWLLLSGEVVRGVVLLLVGVFGISVADNVLRPLLLSGSTSVSGLVIFLGLLGGVAAFGFVGLVLGPIILVITGSLVRMLARPDLVDDTR